MQELKWSYSGLKNFIDCPRQYHEVKVLKRFNKAPTKQTLYGNVVHKALEHYVKDGTPLERNYERFKPMLDVFREMEGEKFPEHHMAVRYDLTPCSFGAKDYWARGIAHNDLITCEFQRKNLKELWEDFHPSLKRLSLCMETGVWQENPTPLCGWCPVSTCDHYKDK
jgi:hypothetical protein